MAMTRASLVKALTSSRGTAAKATAPKIMTAAPRAMPRTPAGRGERPAPTACPTRTAVAPLTPSAPMNVKLASPIATWCAEATSGPSAPDEERDEREDAHLGEQLRGRSGRPGDRRVRSGTGGAGRRRRGSARAAHAARTRGARRTTTLNAMPPPSAPSVGQAHGRQADGAQRAVAAHEQVARRRG